MAFGILIGFGFIVGGFASYVASKKGYDGLFWFFLGLFFNLVALIAVAGLPKEYSAPKKKEYADKRLEKIIREKKFKDTKPERRTKWFDDGFR